MNRSHLIPVTVTDKRGRQTTVYRKPAVSGTSARTLPPPVAGGFAPGSAEDRLRRINAGILRDNPNERREFEPQRAEGDPEAMRLLSKLSEDPNFTGNMSFILGTRVNIEPESHREVLELLDRHFSKVMESGLMPAPVDPLYDRRDIDATNLIASIPHRRYMHRYRTGETYTERQELNLIKLSAAALRTPFEGEWGRSNGKWGPSMFLNNEELTTFGLTATDAEVEEACRLIRTGSVTRLIEVRSLIEGGTTTPLSEGVL